MDGRSTLERLLDEIRQRDERPSDLPLPYPRRPNSIASSPTKGTIPLHVGFGRTPPWLLLSYYVDSGSESDEQAAMSDRKKWLAPANYKRVAADRRASPVSPLPQAVETVAKLDCSGVLECASREVARLADAGNGNMKATICLQKNYRALRDRTHYQQIVKGATILQSFVRGRRARYNFEDMTKRWKAAILIQKHVRQWLTRNLLKDLKKDIILLQSVFRGWLVRRHFATLKNVELLTVDHVILKKNEDSKTEIAAVRSEDVGSHGAQIPEGTLEMLPIISDMVAERKNDKPPVTLLQLFEDFDQQHEIIKDDAGLVAELNYWKSEAKKDSDKKLTKYKKSIISWKKYKMQLRDAKTAFLKLSIHKKKAFIKLFCSVNARCRRPNDRPSSFSS